MLKNIQTLILLSAILLITLKASPVWPASKYSMNANSERYALTLSGGELAAVGAILKQPKIGNENYAILDFNCDGKADAAFGAPTKTVGGKEQAGAISIVYGSGNGLTKKNNQFFTLDLSTGANANDLFGNAIAGADLNKDGCTDLIVSAPKADNGSNADIGAVWIFWGSPNGIQKTNAVTLWGESAGDLYGWAIAGGDFNGDGNIDIAASAVGADVSGKAHAGRIYVDYGPSFDHNLRQNWSLNSKGIKGTAAANNNFGYTLYSIDINANGFDDLAIGSPFGNVGGTKAGGFLNIFFGGPKGLKAKGNQFVHLKQPTENDFLGFQITGGYLDNNNFAEVVLTAPGLNNESGGAYVLFGTNTGFSLIGLRFLTDPPAKSGESFGLSAIIADADDQAALLFGAPGADLNSRTNAGAVYAFTWDKNANDFVDDFRFSSSRSGKNYGFGTSLGLTGNVNGKPSVVVGEPGAKVVGKQNAGDAWNVVINIPNGNVQPLRNLSLGNLKGAPGSGDFWARVVSIARFSNP